LRPNRSFKIISGNSATGDCFHDGVIYVQNFLK
jgi:hypothetical protein